MSKGFSPATRNLIICRDDGLCARCTGQGAEIHHRRPRGMGGSHDPVTNSAANGVLLCSNCHRWAESNRGRAQLHGWLVKQGQDPRRIPVLYRGSTWLYLREDGGTDG